MSWSNKVIWSEGMFLQPQHFQQHDRYLEKLLENRVSPLANHGWGFSKLEIDSPSLKLGKIQLAAAQGIFPDGTPFDFPHADIPPLPLEISADLRDEPIYLALPIRRIGAEETDSTSDQNNLLTRFCKAEADVKDSNSPGNSQATLQIGQLRLKLLRAKEITDAFTSLGIVKVLERRTDNQLMLANEFIPPMLYVNADLTLLGYLQELRGLLNQCGESLASLITQPGHSGIAEIADFLRLQTINRYEPIFAHLETIAVSHPERFYATCLSLAGDLAIFTNSHRPESYPIYCHDRLIECFLPLMNILRRLIAISPERNVISIDLQDRTHGYWLAIVNNKELYRSAKFILAASAQVPTENLRAKLPDQIKVAAAEELRKIVDSAVPGIRISPLAVAPRQIPFHAGFCYFELDQHNEFWDRLYHSAGLGINIAGNIAYNFPGLSLQLWAIKS